MVRPRCSNMTLKSHTCFPERSPTSRPPIHTFRTIGKQETDGRASATNHLLPLSTSQTCQPSHLWLLWRAWTAWRHLLPESMAAPTPTKNKQSSQFFALSESRTSDYSAQPRANRFCKHATVYRRGANHIGSFGHAAMPWIDGLGCQLCCEGTCTQQCFA